ncbi:MAG: molybdenum cofactor biosynthesis protein MoaE [Verrucomicrobiota bacterium]
MAISDYEVSITESSLHFPPRRGEVMAGAIVDFAGVVRVLEGSRFITGIAYEAHQEMAEHQMRILAQTALEKFGVQFVFIRHRLGFVPAGDVSVIVRVESGHRTAAFNASQWIMDELKRTVPIWKHPVFSAASVSDAAITKVSASCDLPSALA